MTDIDARNSAKENFPLAQQFAAFSEDLRNIYFFTEEQIRNVFLKTKTHDINLFHKIVDDVERQYTQISMGVSISDYLYENLMSIERIGDWDMIKRKQEIISNIHDILDGPDSTIISYITFVPPGKVSEENIWEDLEAYFKSHVQDFFVVRIEENIVIEKNNKKDKEKMTSQLVQKYISQSRMSGINFYVFIQKNGKKRIGVGIQKWTCWSNDDILFGELAKKYEVTKVCIPLSRFVQR